jgi:hypothetical protein
MKLKSTHIILLVAFFVINVVNAQVPKLFLVDANKAMKIKKDAYSNDVIKKNVLQLTKNADKLLDKHFGSVMDKKVLPPCGNMHEYMSMAAYYWYDSSKPNGKPFIRKDGQKNPANLEVSDDKNFNDIISSVHVLSWAYYFTNENKYADKAIELIRFWFLDTATMMLPNLNHAQIISGIDTGRGAGIIDSRYLPFLLDGISLLHSSKSWKKADEVGMKNWFSSFLTWMMTSKNGIGESKNKNNHKTFYENEIACIALFCGKEAIAKTVFENAKKLIASQIEPDGKQPLELTRTTSLWYSSFGLLGWSYLANVAEANGVDLWHYETKDGRSIKKALDYLLPFAVGDKPWKFQQINKFKTSDFYGLLLIAADKFKDDTYRKQAEKIKDDKNVLVNLLNG